MKTSGLASRLILMLSAILMAGQAAQAAEKLLTPSINAAVLDEQIDWSQARLIAVQDGGRYKTLESFARESFSAMHGKEHLPGLSPLASLMEWLFNREAYFSTPVVRIKDKGLRIHFTAHFPAERRLAVIQTGYLTPFELADPQVEQRMRELEPQAVMGPAMRRARHAQSTALFMEHFFKIVPATSGDTSTPWSTPNSLIGLLPDSVLAEAGRTRADVIQQYGPPADGITPEQALQITAAWSALQQGWLRGNVDEIQLGLNQLAQRLPTMAVPGVYPSASQRKAEARYYAAGKFMWGNLIYLAGLIFGIAALVTHWRTPWYASMAILGLALGVHAYGVALRWYILGRIPVANMFEAVVGSALFGIAIAFVAELFYRKRFFLVAAHATGFLALILGAFVIPGGGSLTTLMGILDDVMLRIHTVLIIASYALIFLASVIALVYIFGYYQQTAIAKSMNFGFLVFISGIVALALCLPLAGLNDTLPRNVKIAALWLALLSLIPLTASLFPIGPSRWWLATTSTLVLILGLTFGLISLPYAQSFAIAITVGGLLWALGTASGMLWQWFDVRKPEPALAGGAPLPPSRLERPIMAGGAPGDERAGSELPAWLHHADWCHLIILNLVFVMLFVGIILGAVWADYSWGRPWGWDPKEVFAMNTWIIYAILIHIRFVTKQRGLWTAWLSIAGCIMMAFNWSFVNFFIVGLHSYA
jgi:ABC-type transport system involved in cytochrome c biogenesis permease subunit